jgi:acetyl-CoA acetyltransferase
MEGPSQLSAFINAYAAIKAGLARHVVCFWTVKEGTGGASWKESPTPTVGRTRADSEFQHIFPYNGISATIWLGVYAQRHFNLYRRSLGPDGAALVNRFRVSDLLERNPQFFWIVGIYGTTPKQMGQIAGGVHGRAGGHQANVPDMAAFDAGAALWSRTDLKASDVYVALLDDGFGFLTMTWLAALGFCSKGESGAFVEGGRRIALDGDLPLNPYGGQLNAGRTHGFGFVHEAVTWA